LWPEPRDRFRQTDREAVVEFNAHHSPGGPLLVGGEIDLACVRSYEAAVVDALDAGATVIDMASVTFIDSSELRVTMDAALSLDGNGPLRLVNVPAHVVRLMQLIRLDSIANIEISGSEVVSE